VNLKFSTSEKKRAKCIAGIPRDEVAQRNRQPAGYFLSEKTSEARMYRTSDSSVFEVERKYSVPPNTPKLKTLLMVDHVEPSVNMAINDSRDRNRPIPPDDHFEPTQSSLFAIFDSGDTTLLTRHTQICVYGDGDLLYYAPYTLTPWFSDLNGDGLQDLVVETSGTTAFFTQKEDGSFEKQE
jgi:hypothetical protein